MKKFAKSQYYRERKFYDWELNALMIVIKSQDFYN